MNQALEEISALLQKADEALSRLGQPQRTPKQRDEDFDEALYAHRKAVAILNTVGSQPDVDEELVGAIAPLQAEAADLEILIAEIRYDETEQTERLPRVRHVGS